MRFVILFFSLTLCLSAGLNAQTDYEQVVATLENYMIGGTENDAERVVSAFHPQAMMKFIRDGKYVETNAAEFFGSRIKPGPKSDRITEIASIDITGHAAVAKLLLKYTDRTFIDYMTLMKIDGQWKIINKSFFVESTSS